MQGAMAGFNRGRARPIQMRIGINTGPVVRGDLGARSVRRDYTVIGDTVNKANRYEANAPPGAVLISQSTYDAIRDLVVAEPLYDLKLKGVGEAVTGWVVKSIQPKSEEQP